MRPLLPQSTAAALLLGAALVVSTTGGAVAGSMITGKQIKNGSVTGKDIKDQSLQTGDLSAAAAAALKGQTGAPGTNGVSGLQLVQAQKPGIAAGATGTQQLACPAGKKLVGASGAWEGTNRAVQLFYGTDLTKAIFFYENFGATPDQLDMQVICANA